MRLDLAATVLVFGCACSAPSTNPTSTPTVPDLPVLHGASVHGPFSDEPTLCQRVYGYADCLKRPSDRVSGTTSVTANGFARVDIVEAGVYDDRCAILFQIADRLYVHDQPGLCTTTGHSVYMPAIRDIAFRDLDGVSPRELVIIADVEIARDEVEGAPPSTTDIPPLTMAIVCGQRGGSTPSCVVATTKTPDAFVAGHEFQF